MPKIERAQIVLKVPFSTRFASVYRFCITSLWEEDLECRPEVKSSGMVLSPGEYIM